jgi:hypothetical protein
MTVQGGSNHQLPRGIHVASSAYCAVGMSVFVCRIGACFPGGHLSVQLFVPLLHLLHAGWSSDDCTNVRPLPFAAATGELQRKYKCTENTYALGRAKMKDGQCRE